MLVVVVLLFVHSASDILLSHPMFLDHTFYLPSMICKALKMAVSFLYQFKIL